MVDFALFCLLISTLLMGVRMVVTSIGLKMTIENEDCPEERKDVEGNKLGLNICNYGSLALNIIAMVLLLVNIAE